MTDVLERYLRQIESAPRDPDGYLQLGDRLHAMERFEEAVSVYDRLLRVLPECGPAWHNRGNALMEMCRWEEAIASYRAALRFMPSFAEAYVTIATALQALGKPYEAMASCHRALAIDPNCAEAHWNLALALLQTGEYRQGWEEFRWRWKKRGYTSTLRTFPQPEWDGAPFPGKKILIYCEQAFGDSIQFARFLPLVAQRGGKVIVECPSPLRTIMESVKGVAGVVSPGDNPPPFDLHLPLMTLPRIFDTQLASIPKETPYILPSLERLAKWSSRFLDTRSFRVGIVWAGRKKPDPNRTCPFSNLLPLADISGVSFYSLQMRCAMWGMERAEEGIGLIDFTSDIDDFADTAALIANLDLVISIDTAVAHLSGALGKETWVLLPKAADWRWMLERDDSPWYPTMRLFRQRSPGDWQGIVKRVGAALREAVSRHQANHGRYPGALESFYEKGLAKINEGDLPGAEESLCRAFLEGPRVPEVFNALGVLAREQGKRAPASVFFRHAVHLDDGYADGHINLGNELYGADLIDEAIRHYHRALSISPEDIRAHQNLGVALQAQGKWAEARASFEKALALCPDYATARWNLGVLKLLTGNLREGFQDFEARFAKNDPVQLRHSRIPLWNGEPFHGRTLLVHAEQGFGDTFQFVRYLSLVAQRGEDIIFECQHESLRAILRESFPCLRIVVRGDLIPSADCQAPLLSLPRIFGTALDTIPSVVPYLAPSLEKVDKWKRRLERDRLFRVGLVWAGRAKPDPKRSASLVALAPLTDVPGVTYYSLQVGEGSDELKNTPPGLKIHDYTHEFSDFSETAAFIANLDLIVTLDSAAAHLAGAMKKQVCLLLPYAPDWRWMFKRADSPWYPTMRLFRQQRPGDWREPVELVQQQLIMATEYCSCK